MTILVTGATGNIGRKVVDHLLGLGVTDIRALTVSPSRAALPDGVEVAVGHIGRPETLDGVFDGIDSMYLAPTEGIEQSLSLATAAGVDFVVDTSGSPDSWWGGVRGAVEAQATRWAHLWPGEFMDNFLIWNPQIEQGDVIFDPVPEVANSAIAMDDIAAMAAKVLADGADLHAGQAYLLTGPRAISRAERIQLIGEVIGRQLEVVGVDRDRAIEIFSPVMGEGAEWYIDAALEVGDGQQPDPAFSQVMGRPAVDFDQWVREHRELFPR